MLGPKFVNTLESKANFYGPEFEGEGMAPWPSPPWIRANCSSCKINELIQSSVNNEIKHTPVKSILRYIYLQMTQSYFATFCNLVILLFYLTNDDRQECARNSGVYYQLSTTGSTSRRGHSGPGRMLFMH